jgi:hypothetical protein
MKRTNAGKKFTLLMSLGLLISAAPRMLELFAHYTLSTDLKDFMTGLGVALVLGSFLMSRIRPAC